MTGGKHGERAGRRARLFIVLCCFGMLFAQVPAVHAQASEQRFYAPALNVPIPGLDFTQYPIIRAGNILQIPFLQAYVNAAYRYLLSITVVVAAIMFIYGAFQYLLGSAVPQINKGKQVMTDAVIGMLLIFAAHTILNIVNPDLLTVKGLSVTQISSIEFSDYYMGLSPNDTSGPTVQAPALTEKGTEAAGGAPAPEVIKGACPAGLAETPGLIDFYKKVTPLIKGNAFMERLLSASQIAADCKTNLGFCGKTAGTLWTLAGVGDPSCLYGAKSICVPHEKSATRTVIKSLSYTVKAAQIRGLRCDSDKECKPYLLKDCVEGRGAAMARAKPIIVGASGSGYPDSWADLLQPGDIIFIYTANESCTGEHASVFLGWSGNGRARVIQGDVRNGTRFATYCLKTSCGNYYPLTLIARPVLTGP